MAATLGTHSVSSLSPLGLACRAANIMLGVWLLVSGLAFAQPLGARWDAVIVGVAIAFFEALACWFEGSRYVNAVLALWQVFATAVVFQLSGGLMWSNYGIALAVFVLALVPNDAGPHRVARPARG